MGEKLVSVGFGRYGGSLDYPFHKFILCVGVAIAYWFGNKVIDMWIDGKEIDIVSLLVTIFSVSVVIVVGKDMIKRIKNRK